MKKNNIIIIITLSISLLCISCLGFITQETIKGNSELTTKSIVISDFSKIDIETFVEIEYSQEKNTGNLEFTVDENLWDYYDIYTKNKVLHIRLKDQFKNKFRLNPTKSLLKVSSEQLESIDISGSSNVNFCTEFTSNKLEIDLAGSGKIYANKYPVNIEKCEIDIAGSGDIHLAGVIQKAKVDIAGSGNMNAIDCEFSGLSVDIAGSGDIEATVTDELNVSIAGSGKVKYKGNPSISTSVAGSGKVIKL
ncbi:MAG: DUF2807 domain-containing protein [Bacteroidales bacterium]|jgi:hypothetical protein|nr:DUF2807 domain-containing protein [Bacteroidales bacterium]